MNINKKLGKDILISELGFGAWAIGGGSYGDVAEQDAVAAMKCYFNNGGNFIDTAQGYADSESIIGRFLKDSSLKNEVVIATKTPNGETQESLAKIETTLDESLKRLGRDYVDLYYFHSPAEDDDMIEQGLEIMQNLKKKGKIRTIGASIKGVNVTEDTVELCKKYIDTNQIDAIQLVYSILRQKTDEVFDKAMSSGVALVGRTSLESGFLTGKYGKDHVFAEGDHRIRFNANYKAIIENAQEIESKFIGVADDSMTSLALRFAMNPEAITNTIVGIKNEAQMKQILEIANKPALDNNTITELKSMFLDKTALFNT